MAFLLIAFNYTVILLNIFRAIYKSIIAQTLDTQFSHSVQLTAIRLNDSTFLDRCFSIIKYSCYVNDAAWHPVVSHHLLERREYNDYIGGTHMWLMRFFKYAEKRNYFQRLTVLSFCDLPTDKYILIYVTITIYNLSKIALTNEEHESI